VPDVGEDGACVSDEESGKFAVIIPGASDGLLVDFFGGRVEVQIDWWDVGLNAVHADVALALLFGIVKGMCVEERPDELAADVFEAEFKCGVLKDRVMAAVESGGADVEALLVRDFFWSDEMVGVAGAGGGDGGVERMSPGVAEGDAGRGGFDEFAGEGVFEHAGLRGHDGSLLYMRAEGGRKKEKKRKSKDNAETQRAQRIAKKKDR
jgi:hypothetical protein